MKSDFIFILIALGTIVCVTCAYPTSSSEIQSDRGKDHASIAKDLLALLNQADNTQEDQKFENHNAESAKAEDLRKILREFTYIPGGGQGAQAVGNGYKIQTSSPQLCSDNNNNMQAEEQIAVAGTMLAPYAVDVAHKMGQFTGRAIKGVKNFIFNSRCDSKGYRYTGQYPGAYTRHPKGPPQYPQALQSREPKINNPSSNEELLEFALLQAVNEQNYRNLFRRDKLNHEIKKPRNLRPKPNHERGFFESIKQFFKNLYQSQ